MSTVSLRAVPSTMQCVPIDDDSGSLAAVAGVEGEQIIVWGYTLTLPSGRTLTIKSGATALTGPLATTGLQKALPHLGPRISDIQFPHHECAEGEALNLVLDVAAQLGGFLYYSREPAA